MAIENNVLGGIALQLGLTQMEDSYGNAYYDGPIDGEIGPKTTTALGRLAKELGLLNLMKEPTHPESTTEIPGNAVLAFFLSQDGEKQVSEHFKVREFACKDGSNPVFIHVRMPDACEHARTINGPFSPSSSYRTPEHNSSVDGATSSQHMLGFAVDIPAKNATPEELYALMEEWLGGKGGLGIYTWGVHVDFREVPARWDYR